MTTVAYVFKVTLNKFAVPRPILREKKNLTNMIIVHLLKNNKYEIFTPFNEGDLNETYIFLQLFLLYSKAVNSFYIAKL